MRKYIFYDFGKKKKKKTPLGSDVYYTGVRERVIFFKDTVVVVTPRGHRARWHTQTRHTTVLYAR